jgi:hypothetical protein
MKTIKIPQVLCSLVAACLALTAMQANAQVPVNYTNGDLVLGLRATDKTQSLIDDLGSVSTFRDLAPGLTLTFQLSQADLSATLGADWYTRIDTNTQTFAVLWALVGARQFTDGTDPNNTLYSTNPNAAPWARHSNSTQGVSRSNIDSMGSGFTGSLSTTNCPTCVIQSNSATNSYASWQPGGSNSFGISFATWNPTNEGHPSDTLYLDRIIPGTGASQLLGFFNLASNGTLTYTAESVPDAVNTASLFAGALLLLGLLDWQRRKTLRA